MSRDRVEAAIVSCVEIFRGGGEILVSPFGSVPAVAARLTKLLYEPSMALTDGEAALIVGAPPLGATPTREAAMPYEAVFDVVWSGRRHVMMMATQIDGQGNQNIAAIGDPARPKTQLIGVRGAPGNTLNHATSYWIPNHSPRSFVPSVDVICGVGNDGAEAAGTAASRYHDLRGVVSNLGRFDFGGTGGRMRLVTVHPGVTVTEVVEATGFEVELPETPEETRPMTPEESELCRELDPEGLATREIT